MLLEQRLSAILPLVAGGAALLVLLEGRWRRHHALQFATCQPCDDTERPTPQKPQKSSQEQQQKPPKPVTPRRALLGVEESPTVGLSKDPDATTRRDCYIGWDDYFMSVAVLSAFRSKDPNRQVGACVVNPESLRIVGIGYNGFPWGCGDEQLPWARLAPSQLDTKYPYVCHAEMNAIMNKNCESLLGCRIYVTLFPCNECAKLIIQSRISEVVFMSDRYHATDAMSASRRLFKLAGVRVRQHQPRARRITIDFDQIDL
tara:strand:- start:2081 stop:2857 length:777 start_codon:yes stop_codon:yes gene_type:complete